MKIYTYFEEINHPQQYELIKYWKISWEREGFQPIVLGLQDAQQDPRYQTFCEKMNLISSEITGKHLTPYGLSCFVRWLAYSTVANNSERFLVSDYDVINSGKWKTWHPITNNLHFFDNDCPCLASGNAGEFGELCRVFFDVTMQRMSYLKTKGCSMVHYHDQEFFQYNMMHKYNKDFQNLWNTYNISFSRKRCEDVAPFGSDCDSKVRAFHISHHNTKEIQSRHPDRYNNSNPAQTRIEIIKTALNLNE